MDIKNYISSGLLENYVLGLLSEKEQEEVVQMMELHPEVKSYVLSLEDNLETYGQLHAVTPPPELKSKIMEGILDEKANRDKKSHLVEMRTTQQQLYNKSTLRWRRMAIAAAIILLCSLGLNIYLGTENNENKTEHLQLEKQYQRLVTDSLTLQDQLAQTKKKLDILSNPDLRAVTMKGVAKHPDLNATVYWNASDRSVYLGKSDLPDLPAGKVYQLWAIVDGKPIDLGLYTTKNKGSLPIKMKFILAGQLQAFAITLENEGGNPTPTMDQMYVMGAVAS